MILSQKTFGPVANGWLVLFLFLEGGGTCFFCWLFKGEATGESHHILGVHPEKSTDRAMESDVWLSNAGILTWICPKLPVAEADVFSRLSVLLHVFIKASCGTCDRTALVM